MLSVFNRSYIVIMGKLADLLRHPDEIIPMLGMVVAAQKAKRLPQDPSLKFCYDMLNKVSRSFAVVIQQLPERLRDAICVFYLVLRALDTVEDDMALDDEVKIPLLRCFHEKSRDRNWSMSCGYGHYVALMENYPLVTDAFLSLDHEYQRVIEDICKRMGNGMADFIPKEVKTVEEYNLYCHYVAGLVGVGLSQLFASSGLESKEFFRLDEMANEMGLFLQKTNIIRDYLEDIVEEPAPRMFWPKEIWGNYAERLDEFKEAENADRAVECLNHMITNALSHVGRCLEYMSKLKDPSIFAFCGIPQVMAIGTLEACFNNSDVFTGVVKMRRGETAKIMWFMRDNTDLCVLFRHYAKLIAAKAIAMKASDPHREEILEICSKIEETTTARIEADTTSHRRASLEDGAPLPMSTRVLFLIVSLMFGAYAFKMEAAQNVFGVLLQHQYSAVDYINMFIAIVLVLYSIISIVERLTAIQYD